MDGFGIDFGKFVVEFFGDLLGISLFYVSFFGVMVLNENFGRLVIFWSVVDGVFGDFDG